MTLETSKILKSMRFFCKPVFPNLSVASQPASASHSCVFCAASWMQNVCKIPECHPKNPHWHFPTSSTIEFLKIALPRKLEYFAETCFLKFHELLNCKKFTYETYLFYFTLVTPFNRNYAIKTIDKFYYKIVYRQSRTI